jgi:DNA-binding MarR family transcriptional regulator
MRKPARRRDIRSLLHVPQHDLQSELDVRLDQLGFPSLRPAHSQLLAKIEAGGVRLPDLVAALGLPKQTVGDMVDDLEALRIVERVPDPDHGVIKRVRLGPKGRVWAAEVKRVTALREVRWTKRLGKSKMKSLRALLEELAATVESTNGVETDAETAAARRRRS